MRQLRVLVLAAFATLIIAVVGTASASAAITFEVGLRADATPTYTEAEGLDPTLCTTMRAMRGAVMLDRDDYASTDSAEVYAALQAGDVIDVYQYTAPCVIPPAWPVAAPVRSITVPTMQASVAAGSTAISGLAPDNLSLYVAVSNECMQRQTSQLASRSPGAFTATLPFALAGQSSYYVFGASPDGDRYRFYGRVPGDSGCIYVDASRGSSLSSKPYEVGAEGLDPMVAPSTRVRLVRGGAEIASANNDEIDLTEAQRPAAGDVVEVYRPKEAATPAYSFTVPSVTGIFDPGNDLVAIDSPGAESIWVTACRPFECMQTYDSIRAAYSLPAGRALFDFATPSGIGRAYDILPGDQIATSVVAVGGKGVLTVDTVQGDLTSPIGKVKLAKKLKAKSINKKLKFKLTSNEAGKMSAKLTLPAKKKGKKPATLASGKANVKAGSNTISLKTTSSGKKALKKIAKGKKSVVATLTLTLTDASGNVTTIVKGTKLK